MLHKRTETRPLACRPTYESGDISTDRDAEVNCPACLRIIEGAEIEQALAKGDTALALKLQENFQGKHGKAYEGNKFDRDTGRQHIIAETREHFLEKEYYEYKDPFEPRPSPDLARLLTLKQLTLPTAGKFSFYCPVHNKDLEGYPELAAIHTKTGKRNDEEEFLVGRPCGDYVFKLARMWCQGGNDSNLCESHWIIRIQQ